LDRHAHRIDDPRHGRTITFLGLESGIEIYDVNQTRALLLPGESHFDRVLAKNGLGTSLTADQTHALATFDVDRRYDRHLSGP
jgi:hypothetical protein